MRNNSIPLLIIPATLALAFGTLGFAVIEGWNFIDSFYMTVITLTTVGFNEVHPLSYEGKIFASFLIMSGVGIATYSVTRLFGIIVEGELFRTRYRRAMERKISHLNGHVIICGCGRLGRTVLKELEEASEEVVVIESDKENYELLSQAGKRVLLGSAYEDDVLKRAGIERAKTLITLLPKDADNVYVALCARDLNTQIRIIARTEDEGGEARLRRAGASEVIAPYNLSGNKIVQMVVRPYVSNFLEVATVGQRSRLIIEEVPVPDTSRIAGKKLSDAELREHGNGIVAAIVNPDGSMIVGPNGNDVIQPRSILIVLGERNQLEKISEVL